MSLILLTQPSQLDQDGQKAGWPVLCEAALLCQAGLMMANELAAAIADDSDTGSFYREKFVLKPVGSVREESEMSGMLK